MEKKKLTSNGLLVKEERSNYPHIVYHYNGNDIIGFSLKTSSNSQYEDYIYSKNIQNDIIRIYKLNDMSVVAEYDYDAFGNQTIITDINNIATINPFRYRSYYYDSETNLYYLKSRYYTPELMRFITIDEDEVVDASIKYVNNYILDLHNNGPSLASKTGSSSQLNGYKSLISLPYKQQMNSGTPIIDNNNEIVSYTHKVFSLFDDPYASFLFGNISYTISTSIGKNNFVANYYDYGDDYVNTGLAFKFYKNNEFKLYVSSNIGYGFSFKLISQASGNTGWTIKDGVSVGIEVTDTDGTTHGITVSSGNGFFVGCFAYALVGFFMNTGHISDKKYVYQIR